MDFGPTVGELVMGSLISVKKKKEIWVGKINV